MSYFLEYSVNAGESWIVLDVAYTGSLASREFNHLVSSSNRGYIKIRYKSDTAITSSEFDINRTSITFNSYYTVQEHKYTCVVKRSEFNNSFNPSLYDASGSSISYKETTDESGNTLIFNKDDENFRVYTTGIGLYDSNNKLVAYSKFGSPLKIEKEMDSVFIIKFDA